MTSQPEQQHRIGLLLELSGGLIAVVAGGLYIVSLTVGPGSSLHQDAQRVAAVAVLLGSPTFLLGLAIHIFVHRRELELAIAGVGLTWPAALVVSTIHLGLWNVQAGADPSQELIVVYGVGVGFVALSLVFSVRKTTNNVVENDGIPAALDRKVRILTERTNELHADSLRARDAQHRSLATALAGTGISVIFLGILLGAHDTPGSVPSTTVTVVGGIGLFIGIFLYYVTPEHFVTAAVVTAVCQTLDAVSRPLSEGVTTPVYTYASGSGAETEVHLELSQTTVSTDGGETMEEHFDKNTNTPESPLNQVVPTGLPLYREVGPSPPYSEGSTRERSLRLAETLNSPLGLVGSVEAVWEPDQLSVRIADSTCGPIDRFDHPVPSLLACGLAMETQSKVVVETERLDTADFDWQVTCRQVADA